MRLGKLSLLTAWIAFFIMMVSAGSALAGAGVEPPPEGAIFSGPEIWGTVVMQCPAGLENDLIAIHFKRVVDCNVETQAVVLTGVSLECPADAAAATNQSMVEGTVVFGQATPYTTKVKNFKIETDGTVSFEAQFKYWRRP